MDLLSMPREVGRMVLYRVDKTGDNTFKKTEITLIDCSFDKVQEFLAKYQTEQEFGDVKYVYEQTSFKCYDLENQDLFIKNTDLQSYGSSTLNLVVEPCQDYENEDYC